MESTRVIKLTQGKATLVDASDYDWLRKWKWSYMLSGSRKIGYAVRFEGPRNDQCTILMHRFILAASPRQQVDHRSGDGLDNRRMNLRLATHSQNQQNRGRNRNNKSGFKGVSFAAERAARGWQAWRVEISCNGKLHRLGYFPTKEAAGAAYAAASKLLHANFANTGQAA